MWDTTQKGFVIPKAGLWHVGASIAFNSSGSGTVVVGVRVNGTNIAESWLSKSSTQAGSHINCALVVNVNDLVQFWFYQNSGASMNWKIGANLSNWVTINYLD